MTDKFRIFRRASGLIGRFLLSISYRQNTENYEGGGLENEPCPCGRELKSGQRQTDESNTGRHNESGSENVAVSAT